MNLLRSILIASFLTLAFIGTDFNAFAQTSNDCTFKLGDTYNHQCAQLKDKYKTTADAIQECTFRVDVAGCAAAIVVSTYIDYECYEFARRYNGDNSATELCTFRTYRCRL